MPPADKQTPVALHPTYVLFAAVRRAEVLERRVLVRIGQGLVVVRLGQRAQVFHALVRDGLAFFGERGVASGALLAGRRGGVGVVAVDLRVRGDTDLGAAAAAGTEAEGSGVRGEEQGQGQKEHKRQDARHGCRGGGRRLFCVCGVFCS